MKKIKWVFFIPILVIILILGFVDIILIVIEALLKYLSTGLTEVVARLQKIYEPPKKDEYTKVATYE